MARTEDEAILSSPILFLPPILIPYLFIKTIYFPHTPTPTLPLTSLQYQIHKPSKPHSLRSCNTILYRYGEIIPCARRGLIIRSMSRTTFSKNVVSSRISMFIHWGWIRSHQTAVNKLVFFEAAFHCPAKQNKFPRG